MCLDDCGDEVLCCICAPIAAILCCKICKDKRDSNDVQQAPPSAFYPQHNVQSMTVEDVYGPRFQQQQQFYPGGSQLYQGPQRHSMQGNYIPPQQQYYNRNNMPSPYVQQPSPYK